LNTEDVAVETVQYIFWFYVLVSAVLAALLLFSRRLPLAMVQWTVVTSSLVDGLFIAGMTLITGGHGQHFVLAVHRLDCPQRRQRAAGVFAIVPERCISLCYALVVALDISVSSNLDASTQRAMDLSPHVDWGEPFVLRMAVLLLTGGLLLRHAGAAGAPAPGRRGGGGVRRARGTVAFRRPARRRVRPPNQKSAGHHQQRRLFPATRPAGG
jgi:hypothetical protein